MKRYLGLDIGAKRTGLALVNDESKVATPLSVISFETHLPEFIEELLSVIEEYEIGTIIVGLPINLKGEHSIAANDVKAKAQSILKRITKQLEQKQLGVLDLVLYDERLSTAQAEKALKAAGATSKSRKNVRDAHAAMVIAQSYIDSI